MNRATSAAASMPSATTSTSPEPTVAQLLGSLVNETGTLVRQEIHLASTEMSQKAKKGVAELGVVGLGGALAHAGLLALIAAVILGLGTLVPMWIAAAVIGVVALAGGLLITQRGLAGLRRIDPLPQRAVETLEQDKAWIKEQVR